MTEDQLQQLLDASYAKQQQASVARPSKDGVLPLYAEASAAEIQDAVQRLASVPMNISMEGWQDISSILLGGAARLARLERERPAPETRAKPAGGAWMIVFDDHEVLPEVFWGEGAEQCAMRAYDQHRTQWSCHLFECIRSTKDDANGGRAALKADEGLSQEVRDIAADASKT